MARKLIVEVVLDAAAYSRQMKKAQAETTRFGASLERTGRKTKEFQKGLGGGVLRGVARGAGGGVGLPIFGGGATVAGAVGAGAVVAGLKKSASAASDLNEQIGKTEVVFGKSGKAVEDWSKTLASSFALSERQALATASSFGALFRPLGFTSEEAATQSEKLTQLGADLASFYNTDVQSALDAIRSGLVGESEPLRQYGVLLSETRVQQEAMTETGKKHAKALTAQEKAAARLTLIFRDSKQAQGDSARSSERFAEQTKILQANIDDLATHIGQKLLPKLTDATKALNEMLAPQQPGKEPSQTKQDVAGLGDAYHWVAHGLGEVNKKSDAFDKLLHFPEKLTTLEKLSPPFLIGKEIGLIEKAFGKEPPVISTGKMDPEAAMKMAHGLGLVADAAKKVSDATSKFRATAEQRNTWFDALIDRRLSRVSAAPIEQQIGMLQRIAAAIKKRIAVTKDITRLHNLEDQLFAVAQQQKDVRAQLQQNFFDRLQFNVDKADLTKTSSDNLAALATYQRAVEKAVQTEGHTLSLDQTLLGIQQAHAGILAEQAAAAQAARQAAQERKLGWLEFALERAQETKTLKDDLPTLRAIESYWKTRIRQEGRTLESVRELWRTRKAIRDLNKQDVDPLAGLFQVSSKGLANILAAGTGLGAAGRRQLGFNIAGAEIQPVHVHLNMDGREVASVVTKQQARAGNRTAKQTSGRRG